MLQPATKPASMMMRVATQMRARSTFTNRTRSVTFSISFGADSSIVAMSVSPSCSTGVADRADGDRKSVVWGKSVSVRVDLGGRRIIKKKTHNKTKQKGSNKKR